MIKHIFLISFLLSGASVARYTPPIVPSSKPVISFSIDGGGVRAIVPALLTAKIEEHLKKPISDIAHVFGGTSAGSIVTSLLLLQNAKGKTRHRAAQVVDLFKELAGQIFVYSYARRFCTGFGLFSSLYPAAPLEAILQRTTYSEEKNRPLTLTDLKKPILITAYKAKGEKGPLWLTTSLAHKDARYNFKVWQAVRASTSAPTFFTPYEHLFEEDEATTFIDGAMFAMNPDHETLTYAQTLYPKHSHFVISLSTGFDLEPQDLEAYGPFAGGVIKVLLPFIRFMFQGQQENNRRKLESIHNLGHIEYHRIHIDVPDEHRKIDDGSLANLEGLLKIGEEVSRGEEFQNLLARLSAMNDSQRLIRRSISAQAF